MSIPIARIRLGIYNWIKDELKDTAIGPEKVIWANQEGPRPSRPYVLMDLVTGPVQNQRDEKRAVSPGVVDVTGHRTVTVSVDAFGQESDELSMQLHSSLEKETIQGQLYTYGISVVRQESVEEKSLRLETKFEKRYGFDVIFNCVSSVRDEPGFIEKVEVSGNGGDPVVVDGS